MIIKGTKTSLHICCLLHELLATDTIKFIIINKAVNIDFIYCNRVAPENIIVPTPPSLEIHVLLHASLTFWLFF